MISLVPARPLRFRVAAVTAGTLVGVSGLVGAVVAAGEASAATSVQVYWTSESRTAGFQPVNGNWYANPATGLAGTPYRLSQQPDVPLVALRLLLDPNTGAGFSVARISFGAGDFTSRTFYTYDDGAADPTLSRFDYAGEPALMDQVKASYPAKDVAMTERAVRVRPVRTASSTTCATSPSCTRTG